MSGSNPLPAGQWANIAQLAGGMAADGLGDSSANPLRGPPVAFVRQPYLGSPPQVVTITGLGNGSGAFILNQGADADQSQGLVALRVGLAPASTGTLTLFFPVAPVANQYIWLADWATLGALTVSVNNLSAGWTASRPLVTGELLLLAYQWAVSH